MDDFTRHTLLQAGFSDPDDLLRWLAAFLRRHPDVFSIPQQGNAAQAMTASADLDEPVADIRLTPLVQCALEHAVMVTTAFSLPAAADYLGVSTSRVRQRIRAGGLFSVASRKGRALPRFQFAAGAALPGLQIVLANISPGTEPVEVQRFFLSPLPALILAPTESPMSPRDWLIAQCSMQPLK